MLNDLANLMEQSLDDENVTTADKNIAAGDTDETVPDKFRESLKDLRLPVAVKCKGRPKDFGKTVLGTLQPGNGG